MELKSVIRRLLQPGRRKALEALFDDEFYLRQLSNEADVDDPLRHYMDVGWTQGLDPHPEFSTEAYLSDNKDVADAGFNPLDHFIQRGRKEGRAVRDSALRRAEVHVLKRRMRKVFDPAFYIEQVGGDLDGLDPLEHFLSVGWREGYDPNPTFSVSEYLAANPDVASRDINPFEHYMSSGREEGRSAKPRLWEDAPAEVYAFWRARAPKDVVAKRPDFAFDPDFYTKVYPGDASSWSQAERHYRRIGRTRGRAACAYDMALGEVADLRPVLSETLRLKSAKALLERHPEHGARCLFELIALGEPVDKQLSKFSSRAYLKAFPDVEAAGLNAWYHYATTGIAEGRGEAPDAVTSFWREHAPASVRSRRANFDFDPEFYTRVYADAPRSYAEAERHFHRSGRSEGRAGCAYDMAKSEVGELRPVLLELARTKAIKRLLEEYPDHGPRCFYELVALGEPADRKISKFSSEAYLDMYPDVKDAGVEALHHYLTSGRKEGRQCVGDIEDQAVQGRLTFDPNKPSLLICVHELSMTGAPYVGRRLAEAFERDHNIFIASIKGGKLEDEAAQHAVAVFVSEHPDRDMERAGFVPEGGFSGVVVNSVESESFIKYGVRNQIPVVSYIHEYTEYTRPLEKCIRVALHSDHIIFSSEVVRDSWRGIMADVGFDCDADSSICPQEELVWGAPSRTKQSRARAHLSRRLGIDLTGKRLIYGAGHIQIRKGVDHFVSAAAALRDDPDIVFVWIGDGLNWDEPTFGVWLDTHINRVAAPNLYFLPSGDDYDPLVTAADALFLPSRLDPLPNVVFDAARAGASVVLFSGASGFDCPAYQTETGMRFAPYADVAAAAKLLAQAPLKLETAPQRTASLPRRATHYKTLARQIADHIKTRRKLYAVSDVSALGVAELDYGILFGSGDRDPINARIAERARIELTGRRYIWRSVKHFEAAARAARASGDSVIDFSVHRRIHRKRAAKPFSVHCHAYYPDDLDEVLEDFPPLRKAERFLLTTDSKAKVEVLEEIVSRYAMDNVEILLRPNRGRDILPFIQCLSDPDIAGSDDSAWLHIHLKRSAGTTEHGRAWRDYMLSLLVGDERGRSSAASLITNEDTGVVAPFDPFCIGWGRSRDLLAKFQGRFEHPLPRTLLAFPVGNMFWAKRSVVTAMADVFGPNYVWPQEPLANDGTEYHFIERLWPSAAHEVGLKTRLIYDETLWRV